MHRILRDVAVVAVLALAGRWVAAAEENPFKNAKVGDFVKYKMVNDVAGMKQEMGMTQTVTAKDETAVTLKIEMEAAGNKLPSQETKVALDQPYDPFKTGAPNAKVEKVGEGEEKVTVGGKEYACKWFQAKVAVTAPTGQEVTGSSKVWICKDVPLGGLVKMESQNEIKMGDKTMQTTSTMTLIESGSAGK